MLSLASSLTKLQAGVCLLIALALFSASCAEKKIPSPPPPAAAVESLPSPPPPPVRSYGERGTASWYGKELDGKKTASGETFDMNALTAAHRLLPFGTIIRVTNLDNSKSVEVRITDRGPFIRSRVLELSYGAAKELGFVSQGTARVAIEVVKAVRDSGPYTVAAAIYTEQENARLLKERLNEKFEVVSIIPFKTNLARFYRVQVGSYASVERAEQIAAKLALEGLEPVVIRKNDQNQKIRTKKRAAEDE
ncbi:MAG TPA: septal ring lytic transglycosylase RlpA family protein [Nitrospirota bacterium]